MADRTDYRTGDAQRALQRALGAGRIGWWEWEVEADRLRVSPELAAMHGLAAGADRRLDDLLRSLHADDRAPLRRELERVVAASGPWRLEFRTPRPDGGVCWHEGKGEAFRDDHGRRQVVGVHIDITPRKEAEERRAFLTEALTVLASSLDPRATLAHLASLAVPALSDWCAIDLLVDGDCQRLTVCHSDPGKVDLAHQLRQRYPYRPDDPVPRVLRSGEALLIDEVDEQALRGWTHDDEHYRILEQLGLRCAMIVPLVARGRILGAISMVMAESGRRFAEVDLAHAKDLARHAALAIDNARLHEESQAALADLRIAEEQARGLALRVQAGARLLEGILDQSVDHIYVCDADGRYLQVSRGGAAALGFTPGQMIGRTWRDLGLAGEQHERFERQRLEVLATRRPQKFEFTLAGADGERSFEYILSPFDIGDAVGVVVVARDITERRRAEDAARARQQRVLRQGEALFQLGTDRRLIGGDFDEALRLVCETAARILEVERASVWLYNAEHDAIRCVELYERTADRHQRGLELSAHAVPAYFAALRRERTIAADDALHDVRTAEFADGYLRPLGIAAMLDAPIRLGGTMIGVVCHEHVGQARAWSPEEQSFAGSIADLISLAMEAGERKRAEQALARNASDLQRSNAELEQFAYVSSHDLQEPLRMITSYLGLLRGRYAGKLDEKADQFIGFAVDGAARMHGLINDLLEYSRAGRARPPAGPVRPVAGARALAEALGNLRLRIAEAGAEVTSGELPELYIDAGQLARVFQNLIGNAVKFRSQAKPLIRVEARPAPEAEGLANAWRISVIDNGIGIAAEHHGRIFDVFQRLHTREEYPGSGIGLAICKKIIERSGGRIWVESAPGQGSAFHFVLAGVDAAGGG